MRKLNFDSQPVLGSPGELRVELDAVMSQAEAEELITLLRRLQARSGPAADPAYTPYSAPHPSDSFFDDFRRNGWEPNYADPSDPFGFHYWARVGAPIRWRNQRVWREALGLPLAGAVTQSGIRSAYKSKAKELHPDRPGGSHDAMIRLNRAYEQAMKDTPA